MENFSTTDIITMEKETDDKTVYEKAFGKQKTFVSQSP